MKTKPGERRAIPYILAALAFLSVSAGPARASLEKLSTTWLATASPLPEPLTMLVVGAALAAGALFGRRLPRSAKKAPPDEE